MYYCYSIRQGLFDEEMKYVKELGLFVFYDEKTDEFYDRYGNIFNIEGKNLFLRTGILQYDDLINAVNKHNGIPINTKEECEMVKNWPNHIDTYRNNVLMKGTDIINNPDKINSMFSDKVFFKTRNKNYSDIVDKESLINPDSNLLKVIDKHKEEYFILSEPVDILNDGKSLKEYRCFIVNNKVLNISRIHNGLLEIIDQSILDKANEIINKLKSTSFPTSYVLDLFEYEKNGEVLIDILEFNLIETSGTYLYNSPIIKEYDVLHKCPSASIPPEKARVTVNLGFNAVSDGTPSVLYQLRGDFAGDLQSLIITGEIDSTKTYIHIQGDPNDSLMRLNKILFKDFDPSEIKDDNDLITKLEKKKSK